MQDAWAVVAISVSMHYLEVSGKYELFWKKIDDRFLHGASL